MKAAAVLGATGYVGSHVVAQLLRKGYDVHCGTRTPANAEWLTSLQTRSGGKISLHKIDFDDSGPTDPLQLDEIAKGCDSIFFCAGFEKQAPETITFMGNSALEVVRAANIIRSP